MIESSVRKTYFTLWLFYLRINIGLFGKKSIADLLISNYYNKSLKITETIRKLNYTKKNSCNINTR